MENLTTKHYLILMVVVAIIGLVAAMKMRGNSANSNNNDTEQESNISTIEPTKFKSLLGSGEYRLIDIRTKDEFNSGHITGADNIDYYNTSEFSSYLNKLDRDGKYLIYCRSGHRSGSALNQMKKMGFKNVHDILGGYNAWVTTGFK